MAAKYNIGEGTYYRWKWKYGGMDVNEAKRLCGLEEEIGHFAFERQRAQQCNEVWSWDFVEDQMENGARFRILTLLDEHSRESLAIYANWSIRTIDVIRVVQEAIERYGTPKHLRSDNGPEFIAYAIQDWISSQQIKTLYIKPGSPWENGIWKASMTSCEMSA